MSIHYNLLSFGLAALALTGCVADGYENLKAPIDKNVTVLGSMDLPVGKTAPISIGEFLGIDDFGVIDTDDEGNFIFDIDGPSVSTSFSIDAINIKSPGTFSESSTLPCSGRPVSSGESGLIETEIPALDIPIGFIYDGIPEEITEIESLGINAKVNLTLSYKASGVNAVTFEKGLKLTVPAAFVLSRVDGSDFTIDAASNSLVAGKNIRIASGRSYSICAYFEEIDLSKVSDIQGLAEDGHLEYNDVIDISGNAILDPKDVKVSTLPDIDIISSATLSDIKINSVTGKVDTEMQFDPSYHEVEDVPDILHSAILDVRGSGILLKPCNELPCDVSTSFTFGTADLNGNEHKVRIEGLIIPPGDETEIYISQDGKLAPEGVRILNVPDFDKLFYSIPSKIMIDELSAKPVMDKPATFKVSGSHKVGLDYGVVVMPLLFGEDMQLDYDQAFSLSLSELPDGINSIALKMDVVSSVPFDLSMGAGALDAWGRAIENVTADVTGTVSSGSIESPKTSPIEIALHLNGTDPSKISAVNLHLHVEMAKGDDIEPINENESIRFTNIRAGIRDGITYEIKK